ncbi:uncharacterized protein C6G9.01c-like [Phalaenopsis equestris]|uniref:uncharacterized protein C6G9.01c-like n=1 Tax=Phalaenopsis equestris TaxID=78828 RepID=UPI0009E2CB0D|nr:uncharacterized protein C6G9.01c-like [Phalaenopsis equestris]XP_020582418.1 uncharacterized protein C6G9.01c-like [Phalaenopsis equestris]
MATIARRPPVSLDTKKKEMKKKKNMEEDQKNKMGQEIEEIFRANKKKRKESPGVAGQNLKATVATGKEDKKVNKKKMPKEEKEKKKNRFLVDESSENPSKRRRTGEGFAIYSEEELGIGNQDSGNTALCPFDCSCCF